MTDTSELEHRPIGGMRRRTGDGRRGGRVHHLGVVGGTTIARQAEQPDVEQFHEPLGSCQWAVDARAVNYRSFL